LHSGISGVLVGASSEAMMMVMPIKVMLIEAQRNPDVFPAFG
jgi:hypothetical protein